MPTATVGSLAAPQWRHVEIITQPIRAGAEPSIRRGRALIGGASNATLAHTRRRAQLFRTDGVRKKGEGALCVTPPAT